MGSTAYSHPLSIHYPPSDPLLPSFFLQEGNKTLFFWVKFHTEAFDCEKSVKCKQ